MSEATSNDSNDRTKLDVTIEPNTYEILMTRWFDVPRDRLFAAYVDPEAIPHWWGTRGDTTTVDAYEPRPGGQWRFVCASSDGSEDAFHGSIHDVVDGERIVQTFEYEGMPGHVSLETMTFTDQDGGTLITGSSVYQSVADRDGMAGSGMEGGASELFDRLEEYLADAK